MFYNFSKLLQLHMKLKAYHVVIDIKICNRLLQAEYICVMQVNRRLVEGVLDANKLEKNKDIYKELILQAF